MRNVLIFLTIVVLGLSSAFAQQGVPEAPLLSEGEFSVACTEVECGVFIDDAHAEPNSRLIQLLAAKRTFGGRPIRYYSLNGPRPESELFGLQPVSAPINFTIDAKNKDGLTSEPRVDFLCSLEERMDTPARSCYLSIRGRIKAGFTEVVTGDVLAFAASYRWLISRLYLASPGGHVAPALEIGRLIHRLGIPTAIGVRGGFHFNEGVGETCISACSLVFLASRNGRLRRYWEFQADPGMEDSRREALLIHSWSFEHSSQISNDDFIDVWSAWEPRLRSYFNEVKVPEAIVDWMQNIPARETAGFSRTQWQMIGEFPAGLRELINSRCGAYFDEYEESLLGKLAWQNRGAPIEGMNRNWRAFEAAGRCIMNTQEAEARRLQGLR